MQVFDARDYPGEKMRTTRRDGFVIDEGPQIMTSGYHNILGIARDAGMGDEILDAGSVFAYPGRDKLHYFDLGCRIYRPRISKGASVITFLVIASWQSQHLALSQSGK